MKYHMRINGMANQSHLYNLFVDPKQATLGYLMNSSGVDHINYLDLDIQGSEENFFDNAETQELLWSSVDSLHIETHKPSIHEKLRALFPRIGWVRGIDVAPTWPLDRCDAKLSKAIQLSPSCIRQTQFGPVYIRGGILSYYNPSRIDLQRDPLPETTTFSAIGT
jgi:hypothetical protein